MRKTLVPLLAAGLFATPALATDLNVTLDALDGEAVTWSFDDGVHGPYTATTTAGVFVWTVNSASEHFTAGQELRSFCVELFETVGIGNSYDFECVDPTEVPNANGDLDEGVSEAQASLLSDLFSKHWEEGNNGGTEAAAFQLAVWEIVYEGDDVDYGDGSGAATGLSIDDGYYTATASDDATALANSWLADLFNNGISAALLGLFNPDSQDQLTVVPLPAPAMLAGLGLLGVAAGRRRLGKLVS